MLKLVKMKHTVTGTTLEIFFTFQNIFIQVHAQVLKVDKKEQN